MFIYEGHMGGLFTTDEALNFEEGYCEECGDYDSLVGYAKNKEEAWKLLKPKTNINNSGGYDYHYVKKFIKESYSY